jgi:hypothetical protein
VSVMHNCGRTDCLVGEHANFVRNDELRESWKIFDGMLKELHEKRPTPLICAHVCPPRRLRFSACPYTPLHNGCDAQINVEHEGRLRQTRCSSIWASSALTRTRGQLGRRCGPRPRHSSWQRRRCLA